MTDLCSQPGCGRPRCSRRWGGLCHRHAMRVYRYGHPGLNRKPKPPACIDCGSTKVQANLRCHTCYVREWRWRRTISRSGRYATAPLREFCLRYAQTELPHVQMSTLAGLKSLCEIYGWHTRQFYRSTISEAFVDEVCTRLNINPTRIYPDFYQVAV